jgi:hypothetical protein
MQGSRACHSTSVNCSVACSLLSQRATSAVSCCRAAARSCPHFASIADPADGGMLDVVGFDTAAPQVMRDFSVGE